MSENENKRNFSNIVSNYVNVISKIISIKLEEQLYCYDYQSFTS